jgi:uncharacterized protein (TIRG00374 family)
VRAAVRVLLSVAVAAALVLVLLEWTGTSTTEVLATLRSLDPSFFLAALAVQAAIYPVRTLRFWVLMSPAHRPPMGRLLPITAAHILAANVLPAKLGEAALVVYLRRHAGVPGAHGLALLLVSRVLDFATVAGGLALACLALGLAGAYPDLDWLLPLGAALVVPTLAFAWLAARGERLVAVASWVLHAVRLDRTGPGTKLLGFSERVRGALGDVGRAQLVRGALMTLPVWLLVFGFYAVLARGLGMVDLSFPAAVFGASLAILSTLLPINGFAGFGVQDAGWVAGFTALGVSSELATSSGLAAHFVYLGNLCLFGLLGHAAMAAGRRSEPS